MRNITHVPCNGCTECCRWGEYPRLYRPTTKLRYTADGDCEHLDVLNGRCRVFGKPERPVECDIFDCRTLPLRPELEVLMRVLKAGYRRKEMTQTPSEFRPYVKKSTSVVLMRPYVPGEDLTNISVQPGYEPKYGDWIARNDSDPNDQWLVSEEYFKENYVPVR